MDVSRGSKTRGLDRSKCFHPGGVALLLVVCLAPLQGAARNVSSSPGR